MAIRSDMSVSLSWDGRDGTDGRRAVGPRHRPFRMNSHAAGPVYFSFAGCGDSRLANPVSLPGTVLAFLSALRVVLVIAGCVTAAFILLWLPVLGDRLTSYLSRNAPKFAPRIFMIGLGILVTGMITKLAVLDVAGACMIGALVLGWIYDNY